LILAARPLLGTEWKRADAPALGFDAAKLEAARANLASKRTNALLVARNGRIVLEWYAPGHGPERKQGTASLAKSLVAGLTLALAVQDGQVAWDDPASKWIEAWRADARKSKITLRQLASHSSGIEDAEADGLPHEQLTGWKGAFWRRDPDPFSIAIRDTSALFEPGSRFHYSNTGMAALAYAVTAASKHTLQETLRTRIMEPLGVPAADWSIGYGRAYELDGLSLYANWGGGSYAPRAAARVGQMLMEKGRWGERTLIRPAVAGAMFDTKLSAIPNRTEANPAPRPAQGWYTNEDGVWAGVPRDAFCGAGAGHQTMLIVPSLQLVIVRFGRAIEGAGRGGDFWGPMVRELYAPVVASIAKEGTQAPYAASKVIERVEWAPVASIRKDAIDSDNWPITWGDDGEQYTSYGDGTGFAPRVDKKLSLAWARIVGGPDDWRGENIRSQTGERVGDGARGAKASGLLMVDGVLYAFVRNVGNSQVMWSEDRGRTWTWGWKFTESFATPSFLQFGRNYAGARDGYVYLYSQDGPSAYESDDGVVLARVPKERLRDREAYEFYAGAGPVWTKDIAARKRVWEFPAHAQRVDAVYHTGLKRYLLAVGYDHSGAWGIFDAPAPWGPWTTAFHTNDWGLGNTHGYRLPAKWIDGERMQLVFSGSVQTKPDYDAFCVRGMRLVVKK